MPGRRDPERLVLGYAPHRDGDADPGEVVWGWVPYEEDPSKGKDRPVVVIGRWGDDMGADVAAIPLTSKSGHDGFPVGTGAWDQGGRPSYAKLDRLLRFPQGDVRREGCALDRERFDELLAALAAEARR